MGILGGIPVQLALVHSMLLVGVLLPFGLLVVASRRFRPHRTLVGRHPESVGPLIGLVLSAALWSTTYGLELLAQDPVWAERLHRTAFVGIVGVAPTLVLVSAALCSGYRASGGAWVGLLALPLVSIALGATNPLHGLVWASSKLVHVGGLSALETEVGPWFWVHTTYSYACLGLSVVLLVIHSRRLWATSPGESAALLGAVATPWLLNALHLFTPLSPVDPTPSAVVLSAALLFAVVLRDRVPQLLPSAVAALFERSGDPMVLVDGTGRLIHANEAASRILESGFELAQGGTLARAWPELDLPAALEGRHPDLRLVDPVARSRRAFDVRAYPGGPKGDGNAVVLVALRDVTKRREVELALTHAAHYDEPTGLPNRHFFRERLVEALDTARGREDRLALVTLNVDGLRTINDLHGQEAGDAVLVELAGALWDARGGGGHPGQILPGRLGGDEFALFVAGLSHRDEIETLAEQLQTRVAHSVDPRIEASVSMGAALFPESGGDAASLLRRADMAMQAAKREGGARIRFFEPAMDKAADRRATLSRELWKAIHADRFALVFQPKVDLTTRQVLGFEALLRWTHPELGPIPPDEFIDVAEKNGCIGDIGRWVLGRTCEILAQWSDQGLGPLRVAINVSAQELRHREFATGVLSALQHHGLQASQLEIEITERSLIDPELVVMHNLGDLRAVGIRVSLDDFGSGYSTLACLSRIDLDTIKMDRSLVEDVDLEGRATGIAAAVITLARLLDMQVVAEGVETEAQAETLRNLRCHQAQGYLYSPPVPAEEVPELLRGPLPLAKRSEGA